MAASEASLAAGTDREVRIRPVLVLVGGGFLFRLLILLLFPVPYGEDAFGRLYFGDRVFLGHWLPLTQLLVFMPLRLTGSVWLVRILFALAGSFAAGAVYILVQRIGGDRAGWIGAILFTLNPLAVYLSLMPYQDVLFVGLLFAALAVLPGRDGRGRYLASLFFGLACLTRYEAWFQIPLLLWWCDGRGGRQGRERWFRLVTNLLLFGWGPLLWLITNGWMQGSWDWFLRQTESGHLYAWNPHLDVVWMVSYAGRMGWWLLRFGSPLIVLGGVELVARVAGWRRHSDSSRLLLLSLVPVLVFFFAIIGQEQSTVFRFCFYPLSVLLVLTALRLSQWVGDRTGGRSGWVFSAVMVIALIVFGAEPVADAAADPRYRLPFEVAGLLREELGEGESAVIVAERSRDLSDAAPVDYQRVVVQAGVDRGRLISSGLLGEETADLSGFLEQRSVRLLVVWRNFEPRLESDRILAGLPALYPEAFQRLEGPDGVEVYRVRQWPY